VLDAGRIGGGASGRNGGQVNTGVAQDFVALVAQLGVERASACYRAFSDAVDTVERLIREESIDCNFSRCGHLEVACKQSHFDAFARSAEFIGREFNHQLRIVPRNDLAGEIGSASYFGGLVDETSAGVNPARYVAGLASAALKAGAAIYENARVIDVRPGANNGSGKFEIKTSRGNVVAGNVLVATSGYTSRTTRVLQKKIIPIGSFIITTERLPDDVAHQLSPGNRMIFDSKHYLHYYRLTPDNRMLFGGRAAFFPETKNTIRRSAEILRNDMVQVFPQLRDSKIDYAWGGTLDFCFDTMPHAGQIDGMFYALGYAGHGVAMATYLGTKMADKICGKSDEIPFAAIPFPGAPLGLYDGRPWFLPFAGAYYKVLDWVS